ncbi:MAG TPA: DUF4105 domain-containing protein [Silvibacterium sp.]|nr:DUF4105 domain-containing protein [Silvibacterium sp.]
MTSSESRHNEPLVVWLSWLLRWLLIAVWFLCKVLLIGWASLALYYSPLPWGWLRIVLALAFLAFGIWVFWWARRQRMYLVFAGLFLVVLIWFVSIRPTHDREWRPDVAVMPRVTIDGDRVRITGVRNFDYRSRTDFTPRWEEREVEVSHLTSIDFFVSYWMPGPVAHTFLSFNFDNAPPLCMSIEARPVKGDGFSPIPSMFKQFELIYVVGDEQDVVGVRTNHRDEDVFMYRINTSAASARGLFLIYLDRINQLADHPEWYHLLSNNCTLNIVRYARAVGKPGGFDIRFVLNGWVDRWLYSLGLLDTSMPFRELRERSLINAAAQAAGDSPDFSERIRAGLPMPSQH